MASQDMSEYYETVVSNKAYSSRKRLYYHTKYILGDLSDVKMALDIGGGAGVLSFYIASHGALKVVCIEPAAAGSTHNITNTFRKIQKELSFGNRVILETKTFQDYDPAGETFDLIISHNSINHLNEEACINLQINRESCEAYMIYFRKLYRLLRSGGRFIAADCSPYNLFQAFGLKNPLMPTIEWHKHQSPYQWKRLLVKAGFIHPQIQWTTFNALGWVGRLIMGNPIMSYLTISHFRLTVWKP
jgi:SAM-dependent methyltransferase